MRDTDAANVDPKKHPTAPPTSRKQAFAALAVQHAQLRNMIARCEELAGGLDQGIVETVQLFTEVAALRAAFAAHNQFEENLLRPLLRKTDWSGAIMVSRMVENHVEEHRSMSGQLESSTLRELRDALASLVAHLDSEEGTFWSGRLAGDARL